MLMPINMRHADGACALRLAFLKYISNERRSISRFVAGSASVKPAQWACLFSVAELPAEQSAIARELAIFLPIFR